MRGTVFYFTKVQEKRANEKFDKILYGYDMLGIKCVKFIKCKNHISVYFENGDFWELLQYRENVHAKRVNIAYVPRDPDPNALMLIKTLTTCYPYNGVIYY